MRIMPIDEITKSILTLKDANETHISPKAIITACHLRGRDELVNRGKRILAVNNSSSGVFHRMLLTTTLWLFRSLYFKHLTKIWVLM